MSSFEELSSVLEEAYLAQLDNRGGAVAT